MTKSHEATPPDSTSINSSRAGDIERIPTVTTTYLAPLPLPTEESPYSPYVSDLNETFLDFGGGKPQVFSWQLTLGGPFTTALLINTGTPVLAGLIGASMGYGWADILDVSSAIFLAAVESTIWLFLFTLSIGLAVWLYNHNLYTEVIPTRFNRQRREVCFMPAGAEVPVFVPWESLSAWVIQAQGATQYGVQRKYGMGMGFHHEGELFRIEFVCGGLPLAIAHWEAVRAYMEYEVHDLKSIQDPMDLQGPDDPPHEGLHTFRNARARLHRRMREKQVGWVYACFWYLYHVMTFWTLPNRIVEWEVRRIARIGRKALPDAMRTWSEPLAEAHWAQPSEELIRLSKQVKELKQRHPLRPITEIFAQVNLFERRVAHSPQNKNTN